MAADDKIVIEIELDDGTIKKGFLKVEKQAQETGKTVGESMQSGFSTKQMLSGLAAVAGSLLAIRKVADLFGQAIRDAAATDEAINRLNVALAQTGKFSLETSRSMVAFADSIQDTTRFSDDAVLSTAALIQTLGDLSQRDLKRATQSALDFSTALGVDVNTAATLVGKAATGNVEAFSRYGIQIKRTGDTAKDFAKVLSILEQRVGGASLASAKTFDGSIAQLKNTFSDLLKSVGVFVTRSPALIETFRAISGFLKNLTKNIKNAGSADVFRGIITNFAVVAQAGVATFLQIGKALESIVAKANAAGAAIRVLFTAGFSERQNQLLANALADVQKISTEFDNLDQSPAISFFDNLIDRIAQTSGTLTKNLTNTIPVLDASFSTFLSNLTAQFKMPSDQIALTAQQVQQAQEMMTADLMAIANSAKQTIGRGVGQAFAAFGAALVKGENALEAFTKAFLQSIAQGAVSLGTEFILRGIAYAFVPGLQGLSGPLIAAGAALAAFGGALGAATGGAAAGGAGAESAQAGGPATIGQELPPTVEQKPTTQIAISIQGDVLDSQDTGLRITEILQSYIDKNGQTVFV